MLKFQSTDASQPNPTRPVIRPITGLFHDDDDDTATTGNPIPTSNTNQPAAARQPVTIQSSSAGIKVSIYEYLNKVIINSRHFLMETESWGLG